MQKDEINHEQMKNIDKIIETKSSRIKSEVRKESEKATQNNLKEIMSKHLAFEYKMKLIENTLKAKMDDLMDGVESMKEKAQAVEVEQISKEVERESAMQEMQARFTEKLKAVEN